MDEVATLLNSFPRVRAPLTPAHEAIYVREYKANRVGDRPVERVTHRVEAVLHRWVAARSGGPVLELGAGTLNHLPFEREVEVYDVVEPFAALYADRPERARTRSVFEDISAIPPDSRYRRIISIGVLEHLTDLPFNLARSGLLLAPEGVFQAGIPSEGGFLWGLGWRLSTGLSYRLRTGLDYATVMRHEHVSNAREIVSLVEWFFGRVAVRRFPLPWHHLSLYAYLEAEAPNLARCEAYLQDRAAAAPAPA